MGRVPVGTRPDSILFYFRRFVTALLALSRPLSEPPVRLSSLPFLSPETLSLAAFIAASLIFVPMLAISTTLLYGVCFYPSTNWLFWLAALLRVGPLVPDVVLDPPGARLPHFLGGGLLAFFSLAPASPGGFVQLVPDVVLNCSLGHILRARLSGS